MKNFRLQTAPRGLVRLFLWAAMMASCLSLTTALKADPAPTNVPEKLVDPNDRQTNYVISLVNGIVVVGHPAQVFTSTNPAPITYGAALTSVQSNANANANANVPGTYALNPTNGAVLTAGTNTMQLATFGGGCFWCAEAVFQRIPGFKSVTSGFAGGTTANPSYEEVCTGQTGHAEVIQIEFDPAIISYEKLLEIFWEAHDPTTLNRQGNDVGTQYRSIILYSDEAQKVAAEKSKSEAARNFSSPIVTQIVPLTKFYSAEAYHQDYYNQHSHQTYCQFVIRPKLQKLISKGVIPNGQN